MAVYAAHLTRTLQGTPSVFQVAAQEALGATVKPALRKLIEYLAEIYPNKCGWCERWYDELYLLLDLSLQYHYLKHYAASFSECFYGLVRVPISPSTEFSSGPRLPHDLERASLALLVLLPYFREKIEKIMDRWREDLEDGRLGKSKTDKVRKAAVKLHSIIHFVSESCKLIVLARYLTGQGEAPTLSLQLLGLTLREAPVEEPDDTWSDFFKSIRAGQFESAAVTFPMVWSACSSLAEYGAFAVQLLRWWDARSPLALARLPAPPPPELLRWWDARSPLALARLPAPPPPEVLGEGDRERERDACSSLAEYGAFAVQLLRWWDARSPLALARLPAPPPPEPRKSFCNSFSDCKYTQLMIFLIAVPSGPTLVVVEGAADSVTVVVCAAQEWRETHQYWGGPDCALVQLYPTYALVERAAKMLYLNTHIRGYPKGLRAGSDPRRPLLALSEGFDAFTFQGAPHALAAIEVWGCGEQCLRDAQLEVKKWQVREAERQRQVKISAADWIEHPDRYLLELAGRPQYNNSSS
ncbi:unnamed protein product [Euphydryas editha]|uniref:TLDc domain-containing protein n=1 Tax=Euphydryas editha TaxID=104508 RepID=A0AAU9U5W2_EUPED|nr:unnamed protein product [Euphydryas editha]